MEIQLLKVPLLLTGQDDWSDVRSISWSRGYDLAVFARRCGFCGLPTETTRTAGHTGLFEAAAAAAAQATVTAMLHRDVRQDPAVFER